MASINLIWRLACSLRSQRDCRDQALGHDVGHPEHPGGVRAFNSDAMLSDAWAG